MRESSQDTLVSLVRHRLLSDIAHAFSPTVRLPPIRQIADELDVSVGTVNQAIKDLVASGVLISRPRLGTRLAPGCTLDDLKEAANRTNTRADGLPLGGMDIQVMIIPNADAMLQEMSECFARAVANRGAHVHFAPYPQRRSQWAAAADGDATVMFQPSVGRHRTIAWNVDQPLIVVATEQIQVDRTDGYDLLCVDSEQGGFVAGRYAVDAGFTTACYVGRQVSKTDRDHYGPSSLQRLAGFERGFGKAIPKSNQLMIGSHDVDHGAQIVAEYIKLNPRPEVVFCAADDPAIGFLIGAHAHGLRATRDYHLIGFDRQGAAMNVPGGPITSVEVPRRAMGQRAAELLESRLAEPDQAVRRIMLGCSMFPGKTALGKPKDSDSHPDS